MQAGQKSAGDWSGLTDPSEGRTGGDGKDEEAGKASRLSESAGEIRLCREAAQHRTRVLTLQRDGQTLQQAVGPVTTIVAASIVQANGVNGGKAASDLAKVVAAVVAVAVAVTVAALLCSGLTVIPPPPPTISAFSLNESLTIMDIPVSTKNCSFKRNRTAYSLQLMCPKHCRQRRNWAFGSRYVKVFLFKRPNNEHQEIASPECFIFKYMPCQA